MPRNNRLWLRISLINLCIVAFLGVTMRYKIGFEFPFFDQKNLQHAHSHFAFSGWVSHTIMVLMSCFLEDKLERIDRGRYNIILTGNLVSAYGMLVFFVLQGYGFVSVFFSVASIVFSFLFGYYYWKDLSKIANHCLSKNWFKAAIACNVLSAFGTFVLAYMMATKTVNETIYLASIYFYLHFQYNGWFFFACMGLLYKLLNLAQSDHPFYKRSFVYFTAAAVPAYFLSTLWLDLPLGLYWITVLAAALQLFTWLKLASILFKKQLFRQQKYPQLLQYLLLFVAFALTVKFALQLASVVPAISKLAFGFRPIVIAYLHLVLLAIISLFLLFYVYAMKFFDLTYAVGWGLSVFSIGVVLNEIVLGLQGIGALIYAAIPYVNELLFAIALLLLLAIIAVAFLSKKASKRREV